MKILLFSTDEYFVQVFGAFLAKKKSDMEVVCYTVESAATEWLATQQPGMILCEEGYLQGYAGNSTYISLGMNTVMPKEGEGGRLNIYQKASCLLEDMERIIAICCGKSRVVGKGCKTIAVYSTEGGSGKSTISYLTAVTAAEQRKTVYWNLEPLFTAEGLYQMNFRHTMEEILYALKSGRNLQEMLYETVVPNTDKVYVLPGMQSFGDYREIDIEVVNRLCEEMEQMGMEWIIVDLPSGVSKFTEELLENSDNIIWVFSDTNRGRKKEETVRTDPYLKRFLGKSSIVRNSCETKSQAVGATAAFPLSGTIRKAVVASGVLGVNQEFVQGCQQIVRNIDEY